MTPLEPLNSRDASIAKLLAAASPADVRAALDPIGATDLDDAERAAHDYARGALALREGGLDEALEALLSASTRFEALGDAEAAALCRCEHWLASIRKGPRSVYKKAIDGLEQIEAASSGLQRVRVVAMHYRGTALRYSGQAEATLGVLLEAFAASDGLLVERAQVLNSLGTLYVVLGAHGAATAVLEHAAELNHQIGDRVSEAISYGQLGSAALAQGKLEAARTYLQKQEWFASKVGDSFGHARALTMLGDLAIDLERADDAVDFAERARTVAGSVTPPLGMWIAYATRTIGRAKLELGEPDEALVELEAARERFRKMGNQLGEALVSWDLAHRLAADDDPDNDDWFDPAWRFASLGLSARVAQVLADVSDHTPAGQRKAIDLAFAAAAQSYPHLASSQEVELVYSAPGTLAEIATRRIAGQRNVGRLAALVMQGEGLFVAAIAAKAIAQTSHALPTGRAAAALVAELPSLAVWVWPHSSKATEIARDLSSVRTAMGDDTRAVLTFAPEARVATVPFAGENGVRLTGVDLSPTLAQALALGDGKLERHADVPWDGEAEALARMSGFEGA